MSTPWQPIANAPRDGRPFYVIMPITAIFGERPARAMPVLRIIRRSRLSADGDGYWSSSAGDSVADSYLERAVWAELDALPLAELYASHLAPGRALPEPFGDGLRVEARIQEVGC